MTTTATATGAASAVRRAHVPPENDGSDEEHHDELGELRKAALPPRCTRGEP